MEKRPSDVEIGMNAALMIGHGLAAEVNPDHSLIESAHELLSTGSEIIETAASITGTAESVMDAANAAADVVGMIVT